MEPWQVLIGVGALLTPVVIAAFARDRQLLASISAGDAQIHDRINRIRDEFVRRDDLAEHLARLDKQFVDFRADMRELRDEIREAMIQRKSSS